MYTSKLPFSPGRYLSLLAVAVTVSVRSTSGTFRLFCAVITWSSCTTMAVTSTLGCDSVVIGTSNGTLSLVPCSKRRDCTLSPSTVTTAHDSLSPVTSSKCAVSPTA